MAISNKRKAAILEDVLHTLNFHRKVTEDSTRVEAILKLVDSKQVLMEDISYYYMQAKFFHT